MIYREGGSVNLTMATRNPVLIVTGGSRGIGAATVELASARGWNVVYSYLRQPGEPAPNATAIQADISVEADIVNLFERAATLGPVRGFVNNAAILERQQRLDEMDAARIRRIFAANAVGAILCAREAVRRMSTKHGGSGGAIVNVSSKASVIGSPNEYIDYAACKGAIDTMTIGLSKEVATEGIRVNGVRPGLIYTEMHGDGGEPGRVDRLKSMVPMQRGGRPDEVAAAIVWLLSDEASYVTGTILDVTGGR
jgi:NAD(P)-dependent dehydrogenase (short-subunit alcohol dehydrogenase family)